VKTFEFLDGGAATSVDRCLRAGAVKKAWNELSNLLECGRSAKRRAETASHFGAQIGFRAWLSDFSRGGLYSRAVPCGLQTGCDDHTLLTFTVVETQVLQGIDLCDWYAGPFNVPYPPGRQPDDLTGAISGSIAYPGGSTPKMRVVASNTQTEYWYWVYTESSQGFYAIDDLPPGDYYIVAYLDDGQAGGHASASHDLIAISVEPGTVTEGVTINDWDAPAGTFPPDPTR
jgi:hypothetical protein